MHLLSPSCIAHTLGELVGLLQAMLHKELTSKTQDIESQYANSIINNDLHNRGQSAGKQVHTVASEVWWLPEGGRPGAGHRRSNRRRRKSKQSGLCWVRFQEDILNIQNHQDGAKVPGGHTVKVTFQRSCHPKNISAHQEPRAFLEEGSLYLEQPCSK